MQKWKLGIKESAAARQRNALLVTACISLLMPLTEYLASRDLGRFLAKVGVIAIGLPIVFVLGAASIDWASRRHIPSLPLIIGGAVISGLLFAGLLSLGHFAGRWIPVLRPPEGGWNETAVFRVGFTLGVANFALWTLAFVFPFAIEDARIRGLESQKLVAEAELAQFRSQFQPHFLLNTLNTIAGLLTEDPREARRLLGLLGDLLRESLRNQGELQSLEEQLDWLRRYAHILQVRHQGQLVFHWAIEEHSKGARLPRLILQPLVENAVNHGALMRHGGGEVTVSTHLSGDKLVCTIADNGPGVRERPVRGDGIGLSSVRRRLALRYQDAASLRLESSAAGTQSILELPRDG